MYELEADPYGKEIKMTKVITTNNNWLLVLEGDKIRKIRISDIDTMADFVATGEIKEVRARKADMSEKNRVKFEKLVAGLTVVNHQVKPQDFGDNLMKFHEAVIAYEAKRAEAIELTPEDLEVIKALVEKYNKNSVAKAVRTL